MRCGGGNFSDRSHLTRRGPRSLQATWTRWDPQRGGKWSRRSRDGAWQLIRASAHKRRQCNGIWGERPPYIVSPLGTTEFFSPTYTISEKSIAHPSGGCWTPASLAGSRSRSLPPRRVRTAGRMSRTPDAVDPAVRVRRSRQCARCVGAGQKKHRRPASRPNAQHLRREWTAAVQRDAASTSRR